MHYFFQPRRALVVAAIACSAIRAAATSVIAPTFAELVAEAQHIVRVEILETRAVTDGEPEKPMIYTLVRCRVMRTLKGPAAPEITLRLLGGRVGARQVRVSGVPFFVTGQRCVLFVENNGRQFCPLVGVMHGNYRLAAESGTGRERILRDNGEPLLSVGQVEVPFQSAALRAIRPLSAAAALSLDEFESRIVEQVNASPTDAHVK